tara:strand:- start:119 stop:1246 length:1128 start_codon:yes stop_codon:yes gene_type:complete
MNPVVKKAIRIGAGFAIIFVAYIIMNGLIGMKEPPSVVLPESNPWPVQTIIVKNQIIQPQIPVEGKVEAWQRVDLVAEVNGVLSLGGKEFREGVRYKKGEVILGLDDSEARSSLRSARAQFLQLTSSTLSTIKIDFPEKIGIWEAYVNSIEIDGPLPVLPEPTSDRERFYIINRGIDASFHSIKASEERLSKFSITAPFDGFVSNALVKPGSLVIGGQPIGVFVGTNKFEIKSSINSEYLEFIKVGDNVEFQFEGQTVATGSLDRISSSVNPTTQSATVYFKLTASTKDFVLRDGMYLPGKLIAKGLENCFEVKVALIENDQIYAVENNALKSIKVETVFESFESALVRGLPNGTVLVKDQISNSFEGMKVNPSN